MEKASETDGRAQTAYCNSCVTSMRWVPAHDGSQCPECGFTLSLYGPFEEKPTLMPAPKQMERAWT